MYKLLDCCCKAGGASVGYHNAGFEVTGVDIEPQPHYPYKFIQADVLELLKDKSFTDQFDVIVASPPCQCYTKLKYLSGDVKKWEENHVNLVPQVRELLKATGKPYVIENVPGAPLENYIRLFGSQFPNLYTQRERWFESNITLKVPDVPVTKHKTPQLGCGFGEDGFITVAGNKPQRGMTEMQTKLYYGFALGGIDWMDLNELTQAIPPAYTQWIGCQLINYLNITKPNEFTITDEFVSLVVRYLKEAML